MIASSSATQSVRAPSIFDRHVAGRSVTPIDLWEAILLSASGRSDVQCELTDDVTPPAWSDDRSAEGLQHFVEELERCARITAGGGSYQIACGCLVDHQEGDGGQTHTVTELRRDGRPVVVAVSRLHYAVGNDESDAVTARQDDLYLVDGSDPLGSVVFSLLGSTDA